MLKTFEVNLDIEMQTANPVFMISQNDLKTVEIILTVTQDRQPLDLTGMLPRIAILKPSGKTVIQDCTLLNPVKGTFQVVLDTQAYNEIGIYTAEVYIYNADQVAVTGTFIYNSRVGIVNDGTMTSSNEWQAINTALANYMTNQQAKDLIDSIIAQNGGVNLQNYYTKTDIDTQMNSVTSNLADSTSQINGNLAVKQLSKGMVTFVFDDANPSIYTAAYPVFTAKNLKACLAYPVSVFWNQNGITLKQSYEMQDAGWEIMSHTVTHTSIDDSFTQEKIRYDLVDSKRFLNRYKLNAKQFVAPNSAYPNGTMAPYFNDLLAKNYDCAYLDGTNFNDPAYANNANPINIYKIKRANMQNATLAQLKAAVDYAETNKTWLVFYEHQIDVNGYTTSQTLSDLLDYIKTKNIDVVTGTEAISKISTKLVAKENPATINQRVMEVEARTGTENLLTNPKFLGTTKPVGWTYNDATVTGGKTPSIVAHVPANSFQVALDGTNTGTNEYVQLYQDFPLSALIEPTPFVFSVYAKLLSGSNATMKLTVVPMVTGSQWSSHLESTTFNLSSTNMRYELPVLIPNFYAPVDNLRVYIQLYNNAANNAVTFSIDRPKLEIGVKATTWSQGKQLTDYFSAKLGASQSLTGATYTKIAFNANTLNLNGSWDDVNGKFTAFLKGLYQFNLQIAITAGVEGGRIILLLYKNGASYRTVNFAESGTGVQGAVLTCIADAVPGDYFEGYVWVSSAQSLTGGACFFDGNLISQS